MTDDEISEEMLSLYDEVKQAVEDVTGEELKMQEDTGKRVCETLDGHMEIVVFPFSNGVTLKTKKGIDGIDKIIELIDGRKYKIVNVRTSRYAVGKKSYTSIKFSKGLAYDD